MTMGGNGAAGFSAKSTLPVVLKLVTVRSVAPTLLMVVVSVAVVPCVTGPKSSDSGLTLMSGGS